MKSSLLLCLDLGFVLQLEVDFLSLITFCDVLIRLLMHFSCLLSGSGGQTTVASPEHCLTNPDYTLLMSKGIRLEETKTFFSRWLWILCLSLCFQSHLTNIDVYLSPFRLSLVREVHNTFLFSNGCSQSSLIAHFHRANTWDEYQTIMGHW